MMTCLCDYLVFIYINKPVTIKHVKSLLHLLDLLLGELIRHVGHAVLLLLPVFSVLLSSQTLCVMCVSLQGTSQYVIAIIVTTSTVRVRLLVFISPMVTENSHSNKMINAGRILINLTLQKATSLSLSSG